MSKDEALRDARDQAFEDSKPLIAALSRPSGADAEALKQMLREESRAAGVWEDLHRELLNAVFACADPEGEICGLHPGPERTELEAVIARHKTVHTVNGPYAEAVVRTPAAEPDMWTAEADGFKSFTTLHSQAKRWEKGGMHVTAYRALLPAKKEG